MTTSANYLRFSNDAQELFEAWFMDNQKKIEDEDLHPAIQSHLAKYRSLMPSLALIFHLTEWADRGGGAVELVSLEAASMAAAWTQYLESHARRLYGLALDAITPAAASLSKKIEQGKLETPFKARTVQRKGWARLTDIEVVKEALTLLEEKHWIKELPSRKPGNAGRPEDAQFVINPKLIKHNNT